MLLAFRLRRRAGVREQASLQVCATNLKTPTLSAFMMIIANSIGDYHALERDVCVAIIAIGSWI